MLRDILYDFFIGFIFSIRFDLFLNNVCLDFSSIDQLKLTNQIWKIFQFNFITFMMISYALMYYVPVIYQPVYGLIKIISLLFHSIHYFDILQKMSSKIKTKKSSTIDTVATVITLFIYQFSIEIVLIISNYVFYEFKILLSIINYIIPVIYHSFYFCNNYWQSINLHISKRIDIFETRWPYYFGYGTISAFLYSYSDIPYVAFIYNLYLVIAMVIPFSIRKGSTLGEDKSSTIGSGQINIFRDSSLEKKSYFRINLSVFTYITEWLFYLISLKFAPINVNSII